MKFSEIKKEAPDTQGGYKKPAQFDPNDMGIGQNVVEYPFIEIGQIATVFYFTYFLVIIPFFGYFESHLLRMKLD